MKQEQVLHAQFGIIMEPKFLHLIMTMIFTYLIAPTLMDLITLNAIKVIEIVRQVKTMLYMAIAMKKIDQIIDGTRS